jgi:predicted RNase H-like HicB family nuclease
MRYTVIVHDEPEPNAARYWAEVPELPGCYTQANTVEKLGRMVREAVALHREGEEDRHPAPTGFLFRIEVPARPPRGVSSSITC